MSRAGLLLCCLLAASGAGADNRDIVAVVPAAYLPGDIIAWDLGGGVLHVGIVTDRKAATGAPLVVHKIGSGAREEDILFRFTVIGHYRPAPSDNVGDHGQVNLP